MDLNIIANMLYEKKLNGFIIKLYLKNGRLDKNYCFYSF